MERNNEKKGVKMSVTKAKNGYSKIIGVMSDVFGSFPNGDDLMGSITPEEIKERRTLPSQK